MKCTTPLPAATPENSFKKQLWTILLLLCFSLCSCFNHFYKTNALGPADGEQLQRLVNEKKYFILHTHNQYFAISNIRIENEQLNGDIDGLPREHQKFLNPKDDTHNRFKKADKNIVMFEVHLYTKDSINNIKHLSMPVKNFYQVDVYDTDKELTNVARAMSIVGITVSAAVLAAVIVSAANGSLLSFGGGFNVW